MRAFPVSGLPSDNIRCMPFDFAAVTAPFRMQPGLSRLADGAAQLTPNARSDRSLLEKLGVLSAHAEQALLADPAFDPAPALAALCAHAAREQPQAIRWGDAGRVEAPCLGWAVDGQAPIRLAHADDRTGACLQALAPRWRLPALLSLAFAEDFAVVDADTGRIPWLAVCLPSHWSPEEKVGRPFAEVHAPVADNATLIAAGTHLMRLVTGGERWQRFVWTITPQSRLDAHPHRSPAPPWPPSAGTAADAQALAAVAHFRTERQTFIPVPGHAQAVFTIHVESAPLAKAVDTPEQARALHAAVASMSPAVLAYRGLADARERLLGWLASRTS